MLLPVSQGQITIIYHQEKSEHGETLRHRLTRKSYVPAIQEHLKNKLTSGNSDTNLKHKGYETGGKLRIITATTKPKASKSHIIIKT